MRLSINWHLLLNPIPSSPPLRTPRLSAAGERKKLLSRAEATGCAENTRTENLAGCRSQEWAFRFLTSSSEPDRVGGQKAMQSDRDGSKRKDARQSTGRLQIVPAKRHFD